MAVTGRYIVSRIQTSALRAVIAYLECVRLDVMPVLANLESRANQVADAEYRRLASAPAGDDWSEDTASLAEAAHDRGLTFYETMVGIRQAVLNLFSVGLLHLLEQELPDLCVDGAFAVPPPKDSKLEEVAGWYDEHFDLKLSTLAAWPTIDELRLVANATKHAEGSAARQLRDRRPELLLSPAVYEIFPQALGSAAWPIRCPLAGDDL
jgi:hypothetical protein